MAVLGSSYINVIPKFPGFSKAVETELLKIEAERTGKETGSKYGKGMASGMAKSGAAIGIFSAVTSKAINAISSSLNGAISRFDTLNNYPRVMESLGYGAEAANASLNKMGDRLLTLPTTLDDMVRLTQGLSVSIGDLGKSTDAALALNDMLLAGGGNMQIVSAAQEQFRQILAKGKPEMQDWKSLTQAMPGQLDQLAKSMLGPTANATDLYNALGGGKNAQTITMQQLIDEIIRLDTEGGNGFKSFKEQAETATGGVNTSMQNCANAVTRGITSVMDAIGKETIAGVFNDLKGGINKTFGALSSAMPTVVPLLKTTLDIVKQIAPSLLLSGAALKGIGAGREIFGGITARINDYATACEKAGKAATISGKAMAALGGSGNLASLGLNIAVMGISAFVVKVIEAAKKQENFTKATKGFRDAIARAGQLTAYSGAIADIGGKAKFTAMSIDELSEAAVKHVDKMNSISSNAEQQISTLNGANQVIQELAGKTDLSTQEQGKLEFALKQVNDQFGLTVTAADVAKGTYVDQNGAVVDLKNGINALIEEKKKEIALNAQSEMLGEAYKQKAESAKTYAKAIQDHNKTVETNYQLALQGVISLDSYNATVDASNQKLGKAKTAYDAACQGVQNLEGNLADNGKALSANADAYDEWGKKAGDVFTQLLAASGTSLPQMKEQLRTLGADTKMLNGLSSEQLQQIAQNYDGSMNSLVKSIANARGISDEQFNAMNNNCKGNLESMMFFVSNYNNTPILDKNGNITVDQFQLVDASGNVLTWNNGVLLDKSGNAVVDATSVMDAQGQVYTWNGTNLEYKDAQGVVHNLMKDGIEDKNAWNNGGLKDWEATGRVNIFANIANGIKGFFGWNAAGGIRKHADGGIRMHAAGAIVNKAVPLDIVGEDGSEAIVPLTNRRYAQPFVDMIAESVAEKGDSSGKTEQLLAYACELLVNIHEAIPDITGRDFTRLVRGSL